jgi:L-asparaginase/Glu-tRNA(Gln) amidotransferase subunit D
MKRLHLLYAGGTIGMVPSAQGLAPGTDLLERLQALPGAPLQTLARALDVQVACQSLVPPIDSAEADPGVWRSLAGEVLAQADEADAFVLLHGTDTLAYSGAALSFRLQGLGKPVVLSGSQRPLGSADSDAWPNVQLALQAAAGAPQAEVMIAFGGRVLRANRATKVAAQALAAFVSPNWPALALGDEAGTLRWHPAALHMPGSMQAHAPQLVASAAGSAKRAWPALAVLHLHPGAPIEHWRAVVAAAPLDGLVLRSYGSGNAPVASTPIVRLLEEARARGCLVVNLSACLHGQVDVGAYVCSGPLADAGALSGQDMTLECTLAKLDWVCSRFEGESARRAAFQHVWQGEAGTAAEPAVPPAQPA